MFLKGVSHFCGVQDAFHNTPKLERFLTWAEGRRINLLRQFLMLNGGAGTFLDAATDPDFLIRLKDHAQEMAARGFYLEVVVFADHQTPELSGIPLSFFDRVCETLDGMGHLVSGGNEWGKNGFDPAKLPRPAGVIAAHASTGTDAQPWWATPEWNFEIFEGSRDTDFERKYKDGRDQYMGDNSPSPDIPAHAFLVPLVMDEMIGIGPVDEPGRTTANAYKVYTFTAGLKMMGFAGIVGHLRSGIFGEPPVDGDPADLCMEALVEAAELPLGEFAFAAYQRGNAPYDDHGDAIPQNPHLAVVHHDIEPGDFRRDDGTVIHYPGDPEGSLRTHGMGDGTTQQIVAPGAGPGYRFIENPKDGWVLVEAYGWRTSPKNVGILRRG